jgi:outer membrane murein-binding lipoprotein Lpp
MNILQSNHRSALKATCVGLLLLSTGLSSYASDADRITQLEKQVQELKLRLSRLESARAGTSTPQQQAVLAPSRETARTAERPVQQAAPSSLPPELAAKWRKLEKGISQADVRGILGEPVKVQANTAFTYWDYPNRGTVTFHQGRLNAWTEPN